MMKAREEGEDFPFATLIGTSRPFFPVWDTLSLKEAISALRFRSAALYTRRQDVLTRRPVDPVLGATFHPKGHQLNYYDRAEKRHAVQLERNISDFYVPRHDLGDLMFSYMSFRFPRAEFVIEMAIC